MPNNSEMYDQGGRDAEHDELNPFYYQHYYYYRRGYDDVRRRMRANERAPLPPRLAMGLAVALAVALALGAGATWWLVGRARPPAEPQALVAAPLDAATVVPRVTPTAAPTPTVPPTPVLAQGGRARVVNLSGSPLRARVAPGMGAAVTARFPEGAEVTLRDGPVVVEGYTWWRVEATTGAGWVVERSPEGIAFLTVIP